MRQTRIFTFETLDELGIADAAGLINHYDIVQVDEDDSIRRWSEATKTWMKRGGKIRSVEDAAGLEMSGGVLRFHPEGYVATNDTRLNDTRNPKSHGHSQSDITGLTSLLAQAVQSESDPIAGPLIAAHLAQTQAHGRYNGTLATSLNVANVERQVAGVVLPANSLRVGSSFKFRAHANFSMALTQSSLSTANVRIGSLSLSGAIAASVTVNNGKAKVSAPFMVEGEITVRSIGVLGTIGGWLAMWGAAAAPFTDDITGLSVFGIVNTTVQNVLELTYVTTNAAASSTFDVALIDGG